MNCATAGSRCIDMQRGQTTQMQCFTSDSVARAGDVQSSPYMVPCDRSFRRKSPEIP
jgi:hypothetical protein